METDLSAATPAPYPRYPLLVGATIASRRANRIPYESTCRVARISILVRPEGLIHFTPGGRVSSRGRIRRTKRGAQQSRNEILCDGRRGLPDIPIVPLVQTGCSSPLDCTSLSQRSFDRSGMAPRRTGTSAQRPFSLESGHLVFIASLGDITLMWGCAAQDGSVAKLREATNLPGTAWLLSAGRVSTPE